MILNNDFNDFVVVFIKTGIRPYVNLYKSSFQKKGSWSLAFNFRFSSRKSQSQQKLTKKITHFTIQFHSKHLTHFTNLNSLNIVKICSRNQPKTLLT